MMYLYTGSQETYEYFYTHKILVLFKPLSILPSITHKEQNASGHNVLGKIINQCKVELLFHPRED